MTTERKATHTPAPWHSVPSYGYEKQGWFDIRDENNRLVIGPDVFYRTREGETECHFGMKASEANRNLIVESPALLALLIRVKHELEYPDDFGDDIDTAIAKATGGAS